MNHSTSQKSQLPPKYFKNLLLKTSFQIYIYMYIFTEKFVFLSKTLLFQMRSFFQVPAMLI